MFTFKSIEIANLESGSHLPKNCLIGFNESDEKSFYFILKTLFILKMYKLS